MKSKILYISYDGMCEPLGQSQVLNYVLMLADKHEIELLSFEKASDLQDSEKMLFVEQKCIEAGVLWSPKKYHKSPSLLATLYDVCLAWRHSVATYKNKKIKIVHCRSYVATLMGLFLKLRYGTSLVFDMRGFWADEKVDSGQWSRSLLYKLVKSLESYFIKKSDHIISLTQNAVDEILCWPSMKNISSNKFSVITTCVSLDNFKFTPNPPNELVLGYVGGAQLWYNFPRALGIFNSLLEIQPNAKLYIINKNEHDYIQSCLDFAEVPKENIILESCEPRHIVDKFSNFSFGLFFIKNLYSKKASMPTKLAEFMAAGVPVITSGGIGDVDFYLKKYNTGLLIDDEPSKRNLNQIISMASDKQLRSRCRELAEKEFSLKEAITKIDKIYFQLSSQD